MAKDKQIKAVEGGKSKSLDTVKVGRVEKPAKSAKNSAKDFAKNTAKAVEKEQKKSKKAKEPTPEPESNSESASEDDDDDDNTSDSSASSGADSSDDEDMSDAQPVGNGKAVVGSDEDSDSDDSDESDDGKPGANGLTVPAANGIGRPQDAAAEADSDASSENDDDDDGEAEHSDSGSDDSSEDDEEVQEKAVTHETGKKRKADTSHDVSSKKTRYLVDGEEKEAVANLFVGQLSWNVDDDWLGRHFEPHGTLISARVITDRDSGRSKGFGYVEFSTPEEAGQALEALQGTELDGRNLRIDFSTPRANNGTPQQKQFDRAKRFGDVAKEPSSTLWVGNLPFDIDQQTLGEYFQEHGSVSAVRLPTDRETGELKGFGYVEMASIDDAKVAFESLQGADVNGRPMRLDYAGARPERQDSFGGRGGGGRGGFGGRGGGRGRGNDRGGRGGRGGGRGGRGGSFNRGGFGDFSGQKKTF